jgi:hypothetical protein
MHVMVYEPVGAPSWNFYELFSHIAKSSAPRVTKGTHEPAAVIGLYVTKHIHNVTILIPCGYHH